MNVLKNVEEILLEWEIGDGNEFTVDDESLIHWDNAKRYLSFIKGFRYCPEANCWFLILNVEDAFAYFMRENIAQNELLDKCLNVMRTQKNTE